ncbi:MAG: hypothetical protein ACREQV_08045 [Candidatus Binatia bacterium]
MANGFGDEELAQALRAFVLAAEPILEALRYQDVLGASNTRAADVEVSRGLRDKARDILSTIVTPGSSAWAAMDVEARSDWWLKRVGTLTAALVSAPGFAGGLAKTDGIQAALGAAGQGLILCAIAHEYGVDDQRDRVRLLASVLFSRTLPSATIRLESRDLFLQVLEDLKEARCGPGILKVGHAIWRLGQLLSAAREEFAKRPGAPIRRRLLAKFPVAGAVTSFMTERSALRDVTLAGREWIAEQGATTHAHIGTGQLGRRPRFGRKWTTLLTQADTPAAQPPGRKLRSNLTIDQCVEMFQVLSAEQGGYSEYFEPEWNGAPVDAPQLMLGARRDGKPILYLAVWDTGVSRELQLVPASDQSQLPAALIETWKLHDGSLSSTGTVDEFPVSEKYATEELDATSPSAIMLGEPSRQEADMGIFGNSSNHMHPTLAAVFASPPEHDRTQRRWAEKALSKEADALMAILGSSGETPLVVAQDTSVIGGNVIVVTDRRTFQLKRGKIRKELPHSEIAETKLGATSSGSTLVTIESVASQQDYAPNDTARFSQIVLAEVATPRIGNTICGHIDRIIGA